MPGVRHNVRSIVAARCAVLAVERSTLFRQWLVFVALAVALSACSDSVPTSTEAPAPSADVVVSATEWRFVPSRMTAEAGSTIVVELRNEGTIIHDWTVLREPVVTESDYREGIRVAGVTAEPGALERVMFEIPAVGEYQIICTIPGHFSSGMSGTLLVVDG